MDVHVPLPIAEGLRRRGVDVLRAQDNGGERLSDSELLDHASTLGRALFSQDDDLLREAAARQQAGDSFAGVIYAHQLGITIGQAVRDLELIAKVYAPEICKTELSTCRCNHSFVVSNSTHPPRFADRTAASVNICTRQPSRKLG